MPCRSDYMEPTGKEKAIQETSKLIVYVKDELGVFVSKDEHILANNQYPDTEVHDEIVAKLCNMLKTMNPEQQDKIIYNGRSSNARRLADWWEAHQKADKEREFKETTYRNNEWFVNNLAGLAKVELANANKAKRPVDRKFLLKWVQDNQGE